MTELEYRTLAQRCADKKIINDTEASKSCPGPLRLTPKRDAKEVRAKLRSEASSGVFIAPFKG